MNENFAKRLRYCTTLPSLPAVAIRIIDLANNPDTNMAHISDQVALDPALAAKFLKVAASPLFRSRRSTTNVRQAVSLLGTHGSIMIALSFSLSNSFRSQSADGSVDSLFFWRRAILSALAARALGEKLGLPRLDELFLGGLLQDIGVLVMDAVAPQEYASIYSQLLDQDELLDAERKVLGVGHDEVGYWLLQNWKLPQFLALACLARNDHIRQVEDATHMTSCIALSGHIADNLLNPDNPHAAARTARIAEKLLGLQRSDLEKVIENVSANLPAAADLFDIPILSQVDLAGIMSEAKDLQMLRNLNKSGELEGYSKRDSLTGAHNRAYYESIFQREFDLASRHTWPLTVAMLDLDHFKLLNDTHGHPAGDAVLISVVRTVQSQLRPDDIFARYGGEEFILILPGTPLDSAARLLVRLKDSIALIRHTSEEGREITVTASIGVASHMDQGVQFADTEQMIGAVDQALYSAKRSGRNQIETWNAMRNRR